MSNLFKEDIPTDKFVWLIFNEAHVRILYQPWRTKNQEKLTTFKDEYRSCVPVIYKSKSFLQVPRLDDFLEPMIKTVHITNMTISVKSCDKHK